MVKERNYLIAEREDDITYLVGGNYFYISGGMFQLEDIKPYIRGKRGLYILIGEGSYYVGEGDVYKRLVSHRKHKKWVDKVYVVVSGGQEVMDKEESLRFEGSMDSYMEENTNLAKDNIDRTRDNEYQIDQHVKRLRWLGLELPKKEEFTIITDSGQRVRIMLTPNLLYEVVYAEGSLGWLMGYHFEKLEDIEKIVHVVSKEVEGKWV